MRFAVIHIRIAIVAFNLVMTGLVGLQTYFGVFHTPKWNSVILLDPSILRSTQGDRGSAGSTLQAEMNEAVRRLVPPPAPPPPAPIDKAPKADPTSEEPKGPDELPPGPLDNTWEYVQCIVDPADRSLSRATLRRKDPSAGVLPGVPAKRPVQKITTKTTRPSVATRNPRLAIPGAAAQGDSRTLRIKDVWKDDDQGFRIRVRDITEKRFIYEEFAQKGRLFALQRVTIDIYDDKGVKAEKDEAGAPEDGSEKKPMFLYSPRDRDQAYETWGESDGITAAATTPTSQNPTVKPGAAGPASSPKRPLSQEEAQKAAGEAMKSLQTSKEYLKAPKAEREKLEKLLGTGGTK